MPAGTIKLTNNSTTVTGTGTSFNTELKPGDFIVAVVGGVTYTLGIKSVESNTALTLAAAYNGPTTTGLAWTPVPNGTMVGITAQVAADVAKAIRGLNLDKANWQQVFSATGNATVNLPDGSQFTGPSWNSIVSSYNSKADLVGGAVAISQGGTGAKNTTDARKNLGLGTSSVKDATENYYDTTAGRSIGVADFGLGFINENTPSPTRLFCGFFRFGGTSGDPLPYANGINICWDTSFKEGWQLARATGNSNTGTGHPKWRSITNGGASAWFDFYSSANTTRAADGSLKAASPIARIVKSQEENQRTDLNEMDFEWCGAGTRNAEAAGISITRMDTGVYVLTGSLGLAKEGWQLSPPRDPMGSGDMGIVEAEETESGGITVRLYKRKFMLSDEGEIVLTKGPLIDVPPTSWIDIRLQMPEKETQPEMEAEAGE